MTRRFTVILAADLVDYSLMMGEDEDATIALIHELRESSLEPVAKNHHGEVLKRMGDGWIFGFPSVDDAVKAAVETQTGLTAHAKIRLRMGIHMGDILIEEADIYGAGVNLAARLQTEAPPGGVMISADLFRQLTAKQAESFADAGTFKFKNIAQPVQAYQWRLKDYSAGRRTEEVPAIAVEAFSVAPNDEDLKSAAEDLRDQILYSQSRRTGLKIRDGSVEEIKDATYALRGRLRVARGRARANLSLILKADGSTSWAEVYEGEAEDLYGFCDEIAAKVNSDLRLYINSLDNIRIAEIPDDMLSVSELRTRAAGLFYECSIPAIERCVSVLARACRLSPDDGMALSMWAIAVSMLKYFDFESPDKETLAKLSAAYDRGVELLPRSDFVFFARAQFRATHLRNGEKTMADAKRCHAINPDYPQAHLVLGYGYLMTGGFENAVREIGIACQQTSDPYWPYRAFHKAVAQFCGEDYAGAVSTLDDLIDLKPSIRGFRKLLIIALKAMNDETRAKQEEMAAEALPDEPTFSVQEPPLPDSHLWLRNELAPTLLG